MSVLLLNHDLENDRELDLERYPVQMSIRSVRIADPAARQVKHWQLASELFSRLQQAKAYPLLLVDDLQQCILRYSPNLPEGASNGRPLQTSEADGK